MVKRGWRAVYVPAAVASEKMVPSIEGEFARKRRMMSHTWPIVIRGGMLSPRGYGLAYSLMILSHRVLRYATPALHVIALVANLIAVAQGAGIVLRVTLWLQGALIVAAALAGSGVAAGADPAGGAPLRAQHDGGRGRFLGLAAARHERELAGGGGDAMIRRAVDLAVALALLVLFAPLLAIALVAIRLETSGPAIYRQRRIGLKERRSRC